MFVRKFEADSLDEALLNIKKSDYDRSEKLIKDFKQVCSTFCKKESELIKKLGNLEPR